MSKAGRRPRQTQPDQSAYTFVWDLFYLTCGAAIIAFSFNLFLYPNKIASGGVSGLSIITGHLFGFEPAFVQWLINIPLFGVAFLLLGNRFGLKTFIGTLLLPLFILLTSGVQPVTQDPLLASLFGGALWGVGVGLVFRGKASTGGTALAAHILHKYTGFTLGFSVLILDGLVVLTSALVFNLELGLYALIGLVVMGKTIDVVQLGFGYTKLALIISDKEALIRQAILHELDRGVTRLSATGGYTERERPVLMCVVYQMEITKLKELVRHVDPAAFVIISETKEVLGEGFKRE
jgi:uncharacterized membrane-anchored protein YitT (DUF2179 family)